MPSIMVGRDSIHSSNEYCIIIMIIQNIYIAESLVIYLNFKIFKIQVKENPTLRNLFKKISKKKLNNMTFDLRNFLVRFL